MLNLQTLSDSELRQLASDIDKVLALRAKEQGRSQRVNITTHETSNLINMIRWTITFLVIALLSAVFGFTNIAAGAAVIARITFYISLVFFVISLITGMFRRDD